MTQALPDLERRIHAETEAARAAIKVALKHAVNVGIAYGEVQDQLSQSGVQGWLATSCPVDRHTVMVMRRISLCSDLETKARTVADLMFDRAAEYIAQGARATKAAAHYRDGAETKHCAICTMFRAPDTCTAVKGKISPQALCDYFEQR